MVVKYPLGKRNESELVKSVVPYSSRGMPDGRLVTEQNLRNRFTVKTFAKFLVDQFDRIRDDNIDNILLPYPAAM